MLLLKDQKSADRVRRQLTDQGGPLTYFNDGGGGIRQRFIFYTQKIPNFRVCLPKKITTLFSIPKKNPLILFSQPKKIPLFFFATQKNPGVFHRPKKITFGQNFRPQKITRTPPPPSLKYVSGVPGLMDLSRKINHEVQPVLEFRKVVRTIQSFGSGALRRSLYLVYLVYFWGFCPFQFFIVPLQKKILASLLVESLNQSLLAGN